MYVSCISIVAIEAQLSRRETLAGYLVGPALGAALLLGPAPAAMAGFFGAPEMVAPSADAVNRDLLKSDKVQQGLKDTRFYQNVVREVTQQTSTSFRPTRSTVPKIIQTRFSRVILQMQKQLASDPQLDLGPAISKNFPADKIRSAMNQAVTAIDDEDMQIDPDRLVRNVIQDVTEVSCLAFN